MKVKNIAFSGFAAAILAGVCSNAFAVSVNLASKQYVDDALEAKVNQIDFEDLKTTVGKKATQEALEIVTTQVNTNTSDIADLKSGKQNALTAGSNITIEGNVISATGGVSSEQLTELQTTLEAAIAEKQAKGDYLVAADLQDLNDAVSALQSGKADASTVATIQETINKLGDTYAAKSDLTAAEERLQAAIATSIDLTPYAKTADVNAALALKADKSELTNFVTGTQLSELRTALEEEIAKKQAAGNYAEAQALQNVATELGTLKNGVYTKAEVDQKIADAISGGEGSIDLSGYATQSALDALTLLVNGNADEITALKNAGYQTASDVQGAITTATAGLATKADVNAKQDKLTQGTNISIEGNVISATGLATSTELTNLQTTLEAAIAEKQAKGDYLVAADLQDLNDAVSALQSGKADASTVTTIQETINKLGDTYAAKSDLTAAEERLQSAITNIDLTPYAKTADLAKVATTGQYADLEGKPEIPSIAGLATNAELSNLQTTLEAAIAEKQAKGDYLVAADLQDLNDAVSALQSGKADASTVSTIQETINKLGDTYASKSDLTAAEERLQSAIDAIDVPSLADYAKTADVNAALALKADKSELTNYVTGTQLSELRTALEAAIAEKQAKGDYAEAQALQSVATELGTLKNGVYTKAEVDQKIADAISGGEGSIDLSGYATKSALDALTLLVNGKQDKLTAGAGITIDNNTISATVDTSSMITKPAEQPTTFGEYVLILNINEAGESEGYSWLDTLDLMGDSGFDM